MLRQTEQDVLLAMEDVELGDAFVVCPYLVDECPDLGRKLDKVAARRELTLKITRHYNREINVIRVIRKQDNKESENA